MRKCLIVFLMLLSVTLSSQEDDGIRFFSGTWEEALSEAKSQNKLLFVDVWASWCGPCKRMSAETFTRKEAGDYFNERFICYKVMTDPDDESARKKAEEIAKKYQAVSLPTLLWLDGDGNMLHSSVGFKKVEELISEAEIAQDPERRFQSVLDRWNKGDRSLETGLKYFAKYPTASDEFDDFYLQLSPIEQCDTTLQIMLVFRMRLDSDAKVIDYIASNWKNQYDRGYEALDDLMEKYPTAFPGILSKFYDLASSVNVPSEERRKIWMDYVEKFLIENKVEDIAYVSQIRIYAYVICGEKEKAEKEVQKVLKSIENTPMAVPMKEMFEYLVSPLRK